MVVPTSLNKNPNQEDEGNQDQCENRQRKKSFVKKFVDALLYNEGDQIDQSSSQTENEESSQEGPQGDARKQLVLGLQKLGRDRKKNLLVRVTDGLLSTADYSQQDLSNESIKDHVVVNTVNGENAIGESWRQEGIQDIQREDDQGNKTRVDSVKIENETDQKDKPTSVSAKFRQRRNEVVSQSTIVGQLGLPNFGFEDENSEEKEEECLSDSSGHRRQKRSVTLSSSELPVQPLRNRDGGKDLELDGHASVEKPPTVEDRSQEEEKDTKSAGDDGNPSALADKQEVRGLPVSTTIHPAKKRSPKAIKHWLRDLNLYKVCVCFSKNGNKLTLL